MSEINRTTIQEVASLLGEGWSVTEDENDSVYLECKNQKLALKIPWKKEDSLGISGCFGGDLPRFFPYDPPSTSITVAITSDAKRIASAIQKRLLPNYEKVLAQCIKNKAEADEYKAKKQAILKAILEAHGRDAKIYELDDTVFACKPYMFKARYHGSSTVRLEIELPLEKALEVIKVL
jgi:hypothetical protein